MGTTLAVQCCVERSTLEEPEGIPDKQTDLVKFTPAIPGYGKALSLPPPPPRIVTLQRTISKATTIPN